MCAATGIRHCCTERAYIEAGRERAANARDDDANNGGIFLCLLDGGADRRDHRMRECIQLRVAIETDDRGVVLHFVFDIHRQSLAVELIRTLPCHNRTFPATIIASAKQCGYRAFADAPVDLRWC